jgi:hypothetical protein
MAAVLAAALAALVGCASDPPPPPDLMPQDAANAIAERMSRGELNHFKVTFHSDNLIECGVRNDLWKLVEVTDKSGNAWSTTYRLTDNGSKVVTGIDLRESGRGHQILLKGPYRIEVNGITDGAQPGTKYVAFRWDIDWDHAPEPLKECVPRFELSGKETALFQLDNNTFWQFISYLNPEDMQLPPPDPGAPGGVPQISNPLGH